MGSGDGNTLLTGSYNNNFHVVDLADGTNTQFDVNYKSLTISRQVVPGKTTPINKMDYLRKVSAVDFHQKKNVFAVASLNCFFIYSL